LTVRLSQLPRGQLNFEVARAGKRREVYFPLGAILSAIVRALGLPGGVLANEALLPNTPALIRQHELAPCFTATGCQPKLVEIGGQLVVHERKVQKLDAAELE
jgi:hypothetical protein